MRFWARFSVLLALPLAFVVAGFAQSAEASVGVGVQVGPVRLAEAAHAGGRYAFPPVYVVNTGTEAETVTMRVERLASGSGRPVPPSWIQFTDPSVQLGPGQAARIPLGLVVPGVARTGAYLSDLVVTGSAGSSGATARIGVAAATELEFRVGPGPAPAPPGSFPLWAWLTVVALLVVAVAVFAARRSGLRIRVERNARGSSGLAGGRRG